MIAVTRCPDKQLWKLKLYDANVSKERLEDRRRDLRNFRRRITNAAASVFGVDKPTHAQFAKVVRIMAYFKKCERADVCYNAALTRRRLMDEKPTSDGYNLEKQCECHPLERVPVVINHSLMWHDGDVVCERCRCFIRSFDAG